MERFRCGYLDPFDSNNKIGLAIIAIFGVVFFGVGISLGIKARALTQHGVQTTGTVTNNKEIVERQEHGKARSRTTSAVDFLDQNGTKHTFWTSGSHQVGSAISVTYLPDRPEVAIVTGKGAGMAGATIFIVVGLGMAAAAIGGIMWLNSRQRALQDLIERVSPIMATVLYVSTERNTSRNSSGHRSSHRRYRYVAGARIGNESLEFESYSYSGAPQFDLGSTVELYVDPVDSHLYYLARK